MLNGLPGRWAKLPLRAGAGGPGAITGSELRTRASPPLVGLSFLLLAVGVWRHHGPATVVFLVFAIGGYVALGYPGLLTVGIVTIAMGSSSVPVLVHSGLFLRWEALGLLATIPLLDGARLLPFPAGITPVAATLASWCIVSTAWSIAPITTLGRGATFAAVLWVGLVAAPAELSNAQQRRLALLCLLVAGVAGCVAALLLGVVDPNVGRPFGPLRGWLQNSNTLGLWAAALVPSIAVVRGRVRLLAGAAFLAVVVWSESRTAAIVLLLYAITYAAQHPEWLRTARRRAVQLTIASFIVLVVGVLAADPGGIVEHTALGKFRRTSSLIVNLTGTRSRAWSGTLSHVSGAPIQGLGFGTVEVEFPRLGIHFNSKNSSDSYLQMLFETGLIGACLFLGLTLILLAGALPALRDPERAPFARMGIAMIVAALVESILASAGGPFAVIAWTGLGVAAAGRTQPIELWLSRSARALRILRPLVALAPLLVAAELISAWHYKPIFDQLPRSARPTADGLVTAAQRGSLELAGRLIPNDSRYLLSMPIAAPEEQYRLGFAAGLYLAEKVPVTEARSAQWLLAWSDPDAARGLRTEAASAFSPGSRTILGAIRLGGGFLLYRLGNQTQPGSAAH